MIISDAVQMLLLIVCMLNESGCELIDSRLTIMAGPPSLASLAEHPSSCASNASFPPLSRVAVDACAFPSWHQQFRRVTPKATVIPVEQDFIDYLKADGVFLPGASDDSDE